MKGYTVAISLQGDPRKALEAVLVPSLSCGNSIDIRTLADPPVEVRCPCGDESHWLVKLS